VSADGPPEVSRPWGQRWTDVLSQAGPSAARRIQRGQAIARRGAVEGLRIEPGRVLGTVVEDRSNPHRVEVLWPQPAPEVWDAAIEALRAELRSVAALLDGDLPDQLGETLSASGVDLVPELTELTPNCPCPEPASICRHVAAVISASGVLIGRDATLLLRLRGQSREELLHRVRTDHGTTSPVSVTTLELGAGLEAPHGDLDAIQLHPMPVDDPGSLFQHLGEPPGVDDDGPLIDIIERAAAGAWRLAAGDGAQAADAELLITELRAQRVASAEALADALGRDPTVIRAELDQLFDEGAVLRTGTGDRTRYRASPA
jgi:uncharacterized Zn finger protein